MPDSQFTLKLLQGSGTLFLHENFILIYSNIIGLGNWTSLNSISSKEFGVMGKGIKCIPQWEFKYKCHLFYVFAVGSRKGAILLHNHRCVSSFPSLWKTCREVLEIKVLIHWDFITGVPLALLGDFWHRILSSHQLYCLIILIVYF